MAGLPNLLRNKLDGICMRRYLGGRKTTCQAERGGGSVPRKKGGEEGSEVLGK